MGCSARVVLLRARRRESIAPSPRSFKPFFEQRHEKKSL
jgi:hypothetical protein